MSETATSLRSLSGAEDFSRQVRSSQQGPVPSHSDALAELARLVGGQDPFGAASARPAGLPPFEPARGHDVDRRVRTNDFDLGEEAGAPTEPAMVQPTSSRPAAWERAVPRTPSVSVGGERRVEQSPDAWAAGLTRDVAPQAEAPVLTASRPMAPAEQGGSKRTMVVLAAVVLLTGGGIAASFLTKPSVGVASAGQSTGTPTIMAATGPSKVQPETPAGADAPSEPSTLLDKNNNDGTTAAKVVNNVEQPVDLAQAVKTTAPTADAPPPSPFPEPRRVRTVLVRPDGSIIPDNSAASVPMPASTAQPSPASPQARLAFDPQTAMPPRQSEPASATPAGSPPSVPGVDMPPEATPLSSKTTARATPTPAKPKPVAPKPAQTAAVDAATVATGTAATGGGGGFAAQLGAAPGEAEATATANRLAAKFAGGLGGAKPTVVKAQSGTKTVYRIRVVGLSQDGAKAMCAKVTASGGGCFVARN